MFSMRLKGRFFSLGLILSLSLIESARAEDLPPVPSIPLLTSVTPEQLQADYWINRLPHPDQPIKTPKEIKAFNEEIHRQVVEQVDIFKMPLTRPGKPIATGLAETYHAVSGRGLLDVQDRRIPKSFFEKEIRPLMQWEQIPDKLVMQWGAAVRETSVRAIPTVQKMIEKEGDIEFDQLQFSRIKLWTPVGIFHPSSDGRWYYVQAPYVRGWVEARDIAVFSDRDTLKQVAKTDDFLVVTAESIPIYQDTALLKVEKRVTMGTFLPIVSQRADHYVIKIPDQESDGKVRLREAYVYLAEDVTRGYLPYTQKNVIKQAFKLLGARYGWGGMYHGRDCSGFTHDVFLSFGIDMPRDSRQQAFIGTQLNNFKASQSAGEKELTLQHATPGVTLLKMPLHIMLYLGAIDGQFYIIHATWVERISMTSDLKNRINQVVVSDVSLNGGSYLGSLLERTVSINEIR